MRTGEKGILDIANAASKLYNHGYGGILFNDAVDLALLAEGIDKEHPHREAIKAKVCGELGTRGNFVKKKLKQREVVREQQRAFRFRKSKSA